MSNRKSCCCGLGLILAPALAGVLAWSYAHRDFFHAPQAARSLVVASPPARPVADVPAVEPALRAATRNAEPRAPAISGRATVAPAATPVPTALALQSAPPAATIPADDPKAIRALAQRGLAAYGSAANDEQRAGGLRLVQIAALMGDGLARQRLAQDFPRSAAVRSAVPVKDAVRYALHDYAAGGASPNDRSQPFVALAAFFAERDELQTFATAVVEGSDRSPMCGAAAEPSPASSKGRGYRQSSARDRSGRACWRTCAGPAAPAARMMRAAAGCRCSSSSARGRVAGVTRAPRSQCIVPCGTRKYARASRQSAHHRRS